jgi:hypothetical protein
MAETINAKGGTLPRLSNTTKDPPQPKSIVEIEANELFE